METIFAIIQTAKESVAFIKNSYSPPFWIVVALAFGSVGHLPTFLPPVVGLVVFAYGAFDDFRIASHVELIDGTNPLPARIASVVVYGLAAIVTLLTAALLA